jgi:hypothetical protein
MIIGGLGNSRSFSMSTQIVMDHTGDRRHQFDPQNARELADAEKRFKELTDWDLRQPSERRRVRP